MGDFSFGKDLRLLNASDYKAVFDNAILKVSSQQLLMLARFNSLDNPRLGLVIAKKNIRLAVQRNRVKRAIRECLRLQQQQLDNIDIVVLARRGLDQLDNQALQQMIHTLLLQLQKKALRKSAKLVTETSPKG